MVSPVDWRTFRYTLDDAADKKQLFAIHRQIFNKYLSKCFGEEDTAYDSPSEWLNLINPDIFIGEDLQCRVAFVETMGSILHHPCTCDGLHHHDQYKCNELKQIFQDKSFFSKYFQRSLASLTVRLYSTWSIAGIVSLWLMCSDLTTQIAELSKTKDFQHEELIMRRRPTNEPSAHQQCLGGETVQHGQSDDLRNRQQPTNESRLKQQWLSGELILLKSGISP